MASAVAVSPTVNAPMRWAGVAEFAVQNLSGQRLVYSVPSGVNFMLTDLIVGNISTSTYFTVYAASGNCATPVRHNLRNVVVPGTDTVSISLVTGIRFPAGQKVCVSTPGTLQFNARGFLFLPT